MSKSGTGLVPGHAFSDELEAELGRELYEMVIVPKSGNTEDEESTGKMIPYWIPKDELTSPADPLRKMLKYELDNRLSASEVLMHSWFRREPDDSVIGVEK
ncbi:hypothetical protein SAMD00023353_4300560 [Rosellinia necatrix]|uniref:Uncharacterized protein n=1 Tax=Rosellinia necatrix TaxID=77044 RepID=A0A1S8A9C8_ROSNE|nr:hypothetical protein SAMD00023353_4300560 [Rosellinia necatrix]